MKKSTLALVVMGIVALHPYRPQKYITKTVINWMFMAKLKPCII